MDDKFIFEGSTEVEIKAVSPEQSTFSTFCSLGTIPWGIQIEEMGDANEKMRLALCYDSDRWDSFWSIDAVVSICIVSVTGGVDNIVKTGTVCFKHNDVKREWSPIGLKENIINKENGFLVDDKFTVRFELKLKKTTGIDSVRRFNYSFPTTFSDIVFVVEGKKIHANKTYLSVHSSYFASMFSAGFKECGMEEIELKEVKHDEFIDLLTIIYPGRATVDVENVENLLKLSDRFDCPQVSVACEDFLLTTKKFTRNQKLEMASRYRLSELHENCMSEIKIYDLHALRFGETFNNLDSNTKSDLFRMLLDFYDEK